MQKLQNWGFILVAIALSLAITPQLSFGQISALDKPNPNSNQSPQCLDFNQDKICESIVLANGTQVSNPLQTKQPTTGSTSRTAQTTNFLSYQNPALGIKMQYPVGWQLEEDNDKTRFIQQKDIVSLETDVDNNIDSTLSEYVNARIKELGENRQDFKLLESTPTTISGNHPAHKLVYTFLKEDGPRAGEFYKVLRIWSINDQKLYTIAYLSEPDKFSDHLPEVEKSIDSFRLDAVSQPAAIKSSVSNNNDKNSERANDGNGNDEKNWREDPNCWYHETFVCDEKGECDNDNFDCITDCDDGSSVTTGFPCPGESDEGVPEYGDGSGGGDKPDNEPYCDEVSNNYDGYCWDRNVKDPTVYCDQVDPDELGPNETCHDRKDASDDTGLYTCLDGSHEEDWRDCEGGDVEETEEETENCGGEPCTATEKEDSWLEDETEYYEEEPECFENNNGALGDPIPCE